MISNLNITSNAAPAVVSQIVEIAKVLDPSIHIDLQQTTDNIKSKKKVKKTNVKYLIDLKLLVGVEIFLAADFNKMATIISDTEVRYKGKIMSMSKATQLAYGDKGSYRPIEHWMYKNEMLIDRWDRLK